MLQIGQKPEKPKRNSLGASPQKGVKGGKGDKDGDNGKGDQLLKTEREVDDSKSAPKSGIGEDRSGGIGSRQEIEGIDQLIQDGKDLKDNFEG
jgi:hypothetical protein